jgi:hypothetical protein
MLFFLEAIPAFRYIFCSERQNKRMPLPSGLGPFFTLCNSAALRAISIILAKAQSNVIYF